MTNDRPDCEPEDQHDRDGAGPVAERIADTAAEDAHRPPVPLRGSAGALDVAWSLLIPGFVAVPWVQRGNSVRFCNR